MAMPSGKCDALWASECEVFDQSDHESVISTDPSVTSSEYVSAREYFGQFREDGEELSESEGEYDEPLSCCCCPRSPGGTVQVRDKPDELLTTGAQNTKLARVERGHSKEANFRNVSASSPSSYSTASSASATQRLSAGAEKRALPVCESAHLTDSAEKPRHTDVQRSSAKSFRSRDLEQQSTRFMDGDGDMYRKRLMAAEQKSYGDDPPPPYSKTHDRSRVRSCSSQTDLSQVKWQKPKPSMRRSVSTREMFHQTDCGVHLRRDDAIRALALSVVLPDEDLLSDCLPTLSGRQEQAGNPKHSCSSAGRSCATHGPSTVSNAGCKKCYRRTHIALFDVISDLRWIDRMVRWPFEEPAESSFLTTPNVACIYMAMLYGQLYVRSRISQFSTYRPSGRSAQTSPWLLPDSRDDMCQTEVDLVNRRCLLMVVLYVVYSYAGQQTAYLCWPFIHSLWTKKQFTDECLALTGVLSKPLLEFNRQRDLQWAYTVMLQKKASATLATSTVPCQCPCASHVDVHTPAFDPESRSATTRSTNLSSSVTAESGTKASKLHVPPRPKPSRKMSTDSGVGEGENLQLDLSELPDTVEHQDLLLEYHEPIHWDTQPKKKFSSGSTDSGIGARDMFLVSSQDCDF